MVIVSINYPLRSISLARKTIIPCGLSSGYLRLRVYSSISCWQSFLSDIRVVCCRNCLGLLCRMAVGGSWMWWSEVMSTPSSLHKSWKASFLPCKFCRKILRFWTLLRYDEPAAPYSETFLLQLWETFVNRWGESRRVNSAWSVSIETEFAF